MTAWPEGKSAIQRKRGGKGIDRDCPKTRKGGGSQEEVRAMAPGWRHGRWGLVPENAAQGMDQV